MDNNAIISIIVKSTPIIVGAYIIGIVLYKLYVKIRSKYNANVNCWFCNQNAKVPYLETNSWTCPHCEQYNGFNKDGDYNREIIEQKDCSNISNGKSDYVDHFSELLSPRPPQNGFCDACNEAQRLKVEKLAQFEPKKQSKFDIELKHYKAQLEDQYRLCATCDRHLKKVLREKKKMVLGSKFLNFIIKGAETMKEPHFNHIRYLYLQKWRRRIAISITILSIVNLYCLSTTLPTIRRDIFTNMLGEEFGRRVFTMLSAVLAFIRVITSYLEELTKHHLTIKTGLFVRTIFLMLLYSLGLKLPHEIRCNFIPLYLMACPFVILTLALAYNFMDQFKLTRFSILMGLWSLFVGGMFGDHSIIPQSVLMTFASILTCLLSMSRPSDKSVKPNDSSTRNYHKIYSEDYLSDDETISMLSEQLNTSAASLRSASNRSFCSLSTQNGHLNGSLRTKSPVTSSTFSLNNIPREQLSPNSSYQSFHATASSLQRPQYPPTLNCYDSAVKGRPAMYASNSNLLSQHRPSANIFGSSGNISKHNSSFSFGELRNPFNGPQHSTENLYSPTMSNGFNGRGDLQSVFTANHKNPSPMYSPFSLSSSDVYQQRRTNLLSPSRFTVNYATSTSYSHRLQETDKNPYNNRLLLDHRNGLTEQDISRASSHSSGFESQNGPINRSRENSTGRDSADLLLRTVPTENDKSFQPIQARDKVATTSFVGSTSFSQPLTVNCSMSMTKSPTNIWKRKSVFERDSFNLRKINEELPPIRRGDLLRNWQQSQGIA